MRKKIMFVALSIFVTFVGVLPFYMNKINSETSELVVETGNISILMPDKDIDYNVKILLESKAAVFTGQSFDGEIVNVVDNTTTPITITFDHGSWGGEGGTVAIVSSQSITLNANDKLILKDIPTALEYTWGGKEEFVVDFTVDADIDSLESFTFSSVSNKIQAGTTVEVVTGIDVIDGNSYRPTSDSFTSLYDDELAALDYDMLNFLLNNYNVVSLGDAGASHIVGPVLVKENVRKYTNSYFDNPLTPGSNGVMTISDYALGKSSYVGNIDLLDDNTLEFRLGYGFESYQHGSGLLAPNFYTNTDGTFITDIGDVENYIIHKDNKGFKLVGANNDGYAFTYQNDNFIDFDSMATEIQQFSNSLLQNGVVEDISIETVIVENAGEELIIEVGKNYVIKDASELVTVKLKFPEGYDIITNPYPIPTTINFECSELRQVEKLGITHSIFPKMLVGTEDASGNVTYTDVDNGKGEGFEYSHAGNNIIWNLPNLVTSDDGTVNRLTVGNSTSNKHGHIIAPNASIYNYDPEAVYGDSNFTWLGGNWNGAIIAKNAYMGNLEVHFWPYGDFKSAPATNLTADKELEGGTLIDEQFEFLLDYDANLSTPSIESSSPIMDLELPYTMKNDENGNIVLPSIKINQAGEFVFTLNEIVDSSDTIHIYDKSVYQIIITVVDDGDSLSSTYVIKKTHGIDGVVLDTPETVTDILFKNKVAPLEPETFDFTFKKTNDSGEVLSGVQFELQEVVSNTDHNIVIGSNVLNVTSGIDGFVNFTELDRSKVYKLTETVTKAGYILPTGYWIVESDELGNVTVTEYDGAPKFENNTIINFEEITEMPATGGPGTNVYYLIGVLLILTGFILLKKEIDYENKFN